MQVETINKIHDFGPAMMYYLLTITLVCRKQQVGGKQNVRVKQSVKQRFGETLTNNETRN